MESGLRVCVVGGINVDVVGTPSSPMIHGDSNPGRVHVSLGGVGRNIAENAALLGMRVTMLTALGEDTQTPWILADCEARGIRLDRACRVPEGRNCLYLSLNGVDGDLYAAVSDMGLCQAITPAYLFGCLDELRAADAVVADCNLPPVSLRFLAEHCPGKLAVDPVSVKKAVRLQGLLQGLRLLKPNLPEAEVLTGFRGPEAAVEALRTAGVERVFVTLGAGGACWAGAEGMGTLPCVPGRIVDTNGCGDAFFAAALRAMLEEADTREMAGAGLAAASLCAETEGSVNREMTWERVQSRLRNS